jgi:acyl carrier protein
MRDCVSVAATVRESLLIQWPGRFAPEQLGDEISLGEDGLGLDSIEIVEVLFVCEELCGVLATEDFLADGPITIGRLVDLFAGS